MPKIISVFEYFTSFSKKFREYILNHTLIEEMKITPKGTLSHRLISFPYPLYTQYFEVYKYLFFGFWYFFFLPLIDSSYIILSFKVVLELLLKINPLRMKIIRFNF